MLRLILAAAAGAGAAYASSHARRFKLLPKGEWSPRPELAAGKIEICDLPLCRVYLVDDANYPAWLVLVPRLPGLREVTDLPRPLQRQLWEEVAEAQRAVKDLFKPFKLNVAAIGNIVDQLHVHVTGRLPTDPSWPGPCYGAVPAVPLEETKLAEIRERLCKRLAKSHKLRQ